MTVHDARDANPFETLGVPLDAHDGDVRKAYAAKLREARGRDDPAAVLAVQSAFEAIRDEGDRRQLRRRVEQETWVRPILDRAAEALANEQPQEALKHYLKALDLSPDSRDILVAAVELEIALGRPHAALEHARRLVDVAPSIAESHLLFARALCASADDCQTSEAGSKAERALMAARHSGRLGYDGPLRFVVESQILWRLGRCDEAQAVLEGALEAPGEIRSRELTLFSQLLQMLIVLKRLAALEEVLDRMRQRLPSGDDQRSTIAQELAELAGLALEELPQGALACAGLADACFPRVPSLTQRVAECLAKPAGARSRWTLGSAGARWAVVGAVVVTLVAAVLVSPWRAGPRAPSTPRPEAAVSGSPAGSDSVVDAAQSWSTALDASRRETRVRAALEVARQGADRDLASKASAVLRGVVRQSGPSVDSEIVDALVKLDRESNEAVLDIIAALRRSSRAEKLSEYLRSLKRPIAPAVLDAVASLQMDYDPVIRALAPSLLHELGAEESRVNEAVQRGLRDSSPQAALAAVKVLERGPAMDRPMLDGLEECLRQRDGNLQYAALRLLMSRAAREPEALAAFRRGIRGGRVEAIQVVGQILSSGRVPPDPFARELARLAVLRSDGLAKAARSVLLRQPKDVKVHGAAELRLQSRHSDPEVRRLADELLRDLNLHLDELDSGRGASRD